jgi:pimeloyl-ACP methyl ester carboxylesterase
MDEAAIVNGIRVVYQAEGHGEPVILLHGNGLSHSMWKYNVGPLSRRFHVIAPDLPGFGLSDKPDAPYGVEYYVAFLESFMDILKIERAALVGHSFLGVVAATFAVRFPHRVTKLVLADACSVVSTDSRYYRAVFKASLWVMARSRRAFSRGLIYDSAADSRLDSVGLLPDNRDSRMAFYRNCSEIMDINLDYLWLLKQVKAPTLVMGGSFDRLVPPAGIRKYGELIRGSRVVLMEKCAHVPNVERPEEFNAEVLKFLG